MKSLYLIETIVYFGLLHLTWVVPITLGAFLSIAEVSTTTTGATLSLFGWFVKYKMNFCKDCRHSFYHYLLILRCRKGKNTSVDLVTGKTTIFYSSCEAVRQFRDDCGKEGKWFERKVTFNFKNKLKRLWLVIRYKLFLIRWRKL